MRHVGLLQCLACTSLILSACTTNTQPSATAQPTLPNLGPQGVLSAEQTGYVLRRLAWAQQLARAGKPLPFRLSCLDDGEDGACDDAREALTGLPLDQIRAIIPIYNTSCIRAVFEYPEDRCPPGVNEASRKIDAFEITIPWAAGAGYSWKIGLAPEQGVEEIQLERSFVHFERV